MSQTVITSAFEQLKAQEAANGGVVILDEFVFASIPGLDITTPIDRDEGLPDEALIVHRQAVGKTGMVNNNAVVYSVVMGADVGDFEFNWVGLLNTANNVVAMIVHAPTQKKIKTATGQQGNVLTRSFLMEYNGASEQTQIITPADTWQIDFTARLNGVDERIRQENIDLYGVSRFFGDGFLVTKEAGDFILKKGTGYVSGIRAELLFDQHIDIVPPAIVWVDVCWKGTLTSVWASASKIVIADNLEDYQINEEQHYVCPLAEIDAAGKIKDFRDKLNDSDNGILSQLKDKQPLHQTLTELSELKPERDKVPFFNEERKVDATSLTGYGRLLIASENENEAISCMGLDNPDGAAKIVTSTGRNVEDSIRSTSGASHSLFPLFMDKLTSYRYTNGEQVRIYGFGSSVGDGATLPDKNTQAPVAKFYEYLSATVNRGGIYPVSFANKSVNGSTVNDFLDKQWPDVISEGIYPDLALFIYGMNDFPTAQFNAGQTFGDNGFKNRLRKAIRKVRNAGGDVVLTTTPHPLSVNYSWSMPEGVSQAWPWAVPAPVSDELIVPSAADSVVKIKWGEASVPAAVRFLRGNDAIRKIATELNCVLIDVEKYWFDAVAEYGETTLFNPGQNVHPNLFGHQKSYWLAFQEFFSNVNRNGWTAPTASHYDVLEVGGTGLYPNPKTADIDLQAINSRKYAYGLRDQFSRLLYAADQTGEVTKWAYTSQSPTAGSPGYNLEWKEKHSRTGGLYTTGDVVSVNIPNRMSVKLFIDVWSSVQTTWAQTIEAIVTNREGTVTFTIIGEHDQTPSGTSGSTGGKRLFTLSAGTGVLNINVLQANSSVKFHSSGFNS